MTEATAEAAAPPPTASTTPGLLRTARRVPFTLGVVALMLVLGVVTGALWSPFEDHPWFDVVAFGAPAFADGRWWTPVTGSLFALEPWEYVAVAGVFLLLVGWTELHLGTRRAVVTAVTCQLVGVVGTAGSLALLARTGWDWAERLAQVLDVGFSAGVVGAVTVTALSLAPPWRFRLSALVAIYVLVALVAWGGIADVEHVVGWVAGLVVARPVLGPRLGARTRAGRVQRDRATAAGYFAISALLVVLTSFAAGSAAGPLGATTGDDWPTGIIAVTVDLVLAVGLLRGRRAWWRVALVLTVLGVVSEALLVVAAAAFERGELPLYVLMLLLDVGALALLVVRRTSFRARRKARPSEATHLDQDGARATLRRLGAGQRLAWMTTWDGSHRWVPDDQDGYVAYQAHAGVAVVLTDPVGDGPEGRAELVDAFVGAASAAGAGSCFFSASEEVAAIARARGWTLVPVAQEAVIDLPGLEFRGKKWQDVRTALNQAAKQGVGHRLVRLAEEPPEVLAQVQAISESWLGDSDLPEMAFTLGGVREALDPEVRVGLAVDDDGRVHGVTSWLPVHAPGGEVVGWTLDVMRRAPDSFRYTMELLIASALTEFRDEGALEASLSGSPLAHGDEPSPGGVDAVLDRLAARLEPLYGFESLHRFKMKFQPRNVPLYLVVTEPATLPLVGLALVRCYLPDVRARELVAAARSSRR
ncbi:bifunctional lysylphosphatidylglycerol flippase/synthetase MprF [Isoptericola sp. NPDC060257]|uniref:bifunctional lysylphosphatidylglycerol flippase/synthetase MprF n=1 Tax=Isoptericola sp. NPDC060257 TaxID=3347087 RepID=UPI00365FCEEA